jgi:two-component system nitrogen regulation sensor histidine kinase NtrY
MVFRRFNINVIVRIFLFALLCILGTVYFINSGFDIYFIFITGLAVFAVFNLIRYFNRSNQELSLFLSSIINEDSSLVFNENTGNKSYDSLHRSINRLNEQIRDARMNIIIQEKFFQAVVENSSTGLLAFNDKGIIKLANTKAKSLLGIEHLHSIKQLQRINKRLIDSLESIEPGNKNLLDIIINDSAVHLSLTATRIKLADQHVKVVAINDISHEIDKQEIDSWQKLIRILNHEIMNSVAPITSLSSTISGYYKEKGKQKEAKSLDDKTISNTLKGLALIEDHGKGLISFVDSYRSLTKLPELKLEEVYVKDIFESVIILAASLQEEKYPDKDISLGTGVEPDNLVICADESLLTRVLFNMVRNSMEALQETKKPLIILEAERHSSGKNIIRIIDNGQGMSQELLEKIFIPFFTTRENGSGIGLSLSRQIINMHNGNVTVKSSPGKGTTMIISI